MNSQFYLGREYDLKNAVLTNSPVFYNPEDLTTHAVITGMTGSGKTGLCIALMEEAALQGIPAILIDPKGDLTNLLLHFPEQSPQDFLPWLDADTIRRRGKTLEESADETAKQWKQGLVDWGLDQERISKLCKSAHYAVYTPGSDAGLQISVLSSLQAPVLAWEDNKEILREKIFSTATALLGLVGYDNIDPLRSREHILISNIFEFAWSQGKDLDLNELILQVQTPPFEKLGAFSVDSFFPSKDRNMLAMTLNNILASPAFQRWSDGAPMDIQELLFADDGKPRHSVFYIAHLSDGERMFFVTMLLSAIETWMRTQSGSISLRALVYFDELYGYLPPTAMPPSKAPLLRMLKQARAFGVGLVLATQNPVDIDYKALSNAGSWFVGKLQTERDKNRLLDGLQSASSDLDRNSYSDIISALGKRVFLLHNVHVKGAILFQTRWTMNFLAGPLTRPQIPQLNRLVGAVAPDKKEHFKIVDHPQPAVVDLSQFQPINSTITRNNPGQNSKQNDQMVYSGQTSADGRTVKPDVPPGVFEIFLPINYNLADALRLNGLSQPIGSQAPLLNTILYRPTLLASASVRLFDRRYDVDSLVIRDARVDRLEVCFGKSSGIMHWDEFPYDGPGLGKMESQPRPEARFAHPNIPFGDQKMMNLLRKDFTNWVYRSTRVIVRVNKVLKVVAGPDVSPAEFRTACSDSARQFRDAEISKHSTQIEKQLATLHERLIREEYDLNQEKVEYDSRKKEETGNMLELGAGLLGLGRKKSITTQFSRNRMSQQAKAGVEESKNSVQFLKEQIDDIETKHTQAIQVANERWSAQVNQIREIPVLPRIGDIDVQYFGIAWMPFFQIQDGTLVYELPAIGPE